MNTPKGSLNFGFDIKVNGNVLELEGIMYASGYSVEDKKARNKIKDEMREGILELVRRACCQGFAKVILFGQRNPKTGTSANPGSTWRKVFDC